MAMDEKLTAALATRSLTNPAKHWQCHQPDNSCCGKRISNAMRRGELDAVDLWTCPICACEWMPELIDGIRYWSPHPIIMVFR